MPVFLLSDKLAFPRSDYAEPDGLLAVGGDLSPERLLLAYRLGIFPWYSDGSPLLWWSPDPRLVLFPSELRVARSLERVIRKNSFEVTFDKAFPEVIKHCASVRRRDGEGTWITQAMKEAYIGLHKLGYAHSVETWYGDELVGGLYGVGIARVFFGESMFRRRTDASKVAFVHLVRLLARWEFELIDCQMTTRHLMRFGAREISRSEFMMRLSEAIDDPEDKGPWSTLWGVAGASN
jgi:leucyl/phenylalanyl-tRNA--protein transferase